MRATAFAFALVAALGVSSGAQAAITVFQLQLTGAQEFPGPGDPDGSGTALLIFDDVLNSVEWEITVNDILLPLTGAHIHNAPAGASGPVVIDFSGQLTGSGLVDADVANVLANPTNYYVNVHNELFPAGAIRGQLGAPIPEPAGWALMIAGFALAAMRRQFQRTRKA